MTPILIITNAFHLKLVEDYDFVSLDLSVQVLLVG